MNLNTSRVGIVSVCYNSMAVLPDMLASVPKNMPVVLVSNAGEDDSSPLAKLAETHDTTLIINKSIIRFAVYFSFFKISNNVRILVWI